MNENQEGVVSENPMINQLWNELITLKNGLIRDIIRKYGWGKTSDQIGGKVVVKQIMAINNAEFTLATHGYVYIFTETINQIPAL